MKMEFSNVLLKETVPAPCAACGVEKNSIFGFCESCHAALPLVIGKERCPGCGAENDGIFDVCSKCLREDERPWTNALTLMRMEGLGRDLIHRYKYGGDTFLARPFGKLAAATLESAGMQDFDFIAPVPLHWSRALSRGYNQTALLCEVIAKELNVPTLSPLRRSRATPKQAGLGREERKRNLTGAFAVQPRMLLKGSSVLLIDDVLTTGSTLAAAATALLEVGAANIRILTLLRA